MSELIRGALVPLFDRLSSADDSAKTEQLLTPDQLQYSIARDLSRLLNTRSRLLAAEFVAQDGTTIDYGMPDISALSAKSDSDLAVLQTLVTHAIQCFEPRLNHVDVKAFASTKFAGGQEMLKWYEDHTGDFWMLLVYDMDSTVATGDIKKNVEKVNVFFENLSYNVVERGFDLDLWNIDLSLVEV